MESGSNCKKAKEGIDFPDISAIIRVFVTVQQVCAFTALTVRKLGLEGKNGFPWDGKRPGDKGEER